MNEFREYGKINFKGMDCGLHMYGTRCVCVCVTPHPSPIHIFASHSPYP